MRVAVLFGFLALCGANTMLRQQAYLRLQDRNGNFRIDAGTANEGAYDPVTRFIYIVGSDQMVLHVIDISNPANPVEIKMFQFSNEGRPLDVEVCRGQTTQPKLAVSFEGTLSAADEGHVNIYSPIVSASNELTLLHDSILVGASPANMKFTPDCRALVVSNEGVPRERLGTFVDPEGTINIIELGIPIPRVDTIDFKGADDPAERDRLIAQNVRFVMRRLPDNSNNLFSRDLEPEYVAISPNGGFAYVTLEENNAIARVDLLNPGLSNIYPMGVKDWRSEDIDASDQDNDGPPAPRNIRSFYQPDRITMFEWGGRQYLATTDEGSWKSVPEAPFQDFARARGLSYNVDATLEAQINDNAQLGRLYVSTVDGIPQGSTQIETVYTFGGRGFSIFDTQTMNRSYESGDLVETAGRLYFPNLHNSMYTSGLQTPESDRDKASPQLGPELNSLAVGQVLGKTCMFMGSGKTGMLFIYCMNPAVAAVPIPEFQSIFRAGGVDQSWNSLYGAINMGDIGIADIELITNTVSGEPVLVVISATSGSMSTYTIAEGSFNSRLLKQYLANRKRR